jgi:hypothetical protein
LFKDSIGFVKKSLWFVDKDDLASSNQYEELIYLLALNYSYLWLEDLNAPVGDLTFRDAVNNFNVFLKLPGAYLPWAEYHLACLFSEAARRESSEKDRYQREAQSSLEKAIVDLQRGQSAQKANQIEMMRCRLKRPKTCPLLGCLNRWFVSRQLLSRRRLV